MIYSKILEFKLTMLIFSTNDFNFDFSNSISFIGEITQWLGKQRRPP
jgi:hypothetical protein